LPFNRCSAPDSHDRRARFVSLLALSDKLASVYRDRVMKASRSSSRAVFEFLALAVRRWPSIWRAGLNSLATIWKRTLINRGWVEAASHSLPTHKAPVPTIVRSCPIADKLLRCRECPLSANRVVFAMSALRLLTPQTRHSFDACLSGLLPKH
jgi:hypothetical protein